MKSQSIAAIQAINMASKTVTAPFFDITLSSDAFQDEFPNNTTSFFKAKLPSTLIFSEPERYKVALHKLAFTNAIHNVGKSVNTRLWVPADKNEGYMEIPLEETYVDTAAEFNNLIKIGLKRHAPHLVPAAEEKMQGDAPITAPATAAITSETSQNFMQTVAKDMQSLIDYRDRQFSIIFDWRIPIQIIACKIAGEFISHYWELIQLDSLENYHRGEWLGGWARGYLPQYPYEDLANDRNWIEHLYTTIIGPAMKLDIFQETTPEVIAFVKKLENTIREGSEEYLNTPEKKQRFYKMREPGIPTILDTDLLRQLNMFFQLLTRVIDEEQLPENQIDAAEHFLFNEAIENIKVEILNVYTEIEKDFENLSATIRNLEFPPKSEIITSQYKNLTDLLCELYAAKTFMKRQPQMKQILNNVESLTTTTTPSADEFNRPPELTIINPDTAKPFKTEREWDKYLSKHLNVHRDQRNQLTTSAITHVQMLINKAHRQYVLKRRRGLIMMETPASELTGDERYYRNMEMKSRTKWPEPRFEDRPPGMPPVSASQTAEPTVPKKTKLSTSSHSTPTFTPPSRAAEELKRKRQRNQDPDFDDAKADNTLPSEKRDKAQSQTPSTPAPPASSNPQTNFPRQRPTTTKPFFSDIDWASTPTTTTPTTTTTTTTKPTEPIKEKPVQKTPGTGETVQIKSSKQHVEDETPFDIYAIRNVYGKERNINNLFTYFPTSGSAYFEKNKAAWDNAESMKAVSVLRNGAITGAVLASQIPRILSNTVPTDKLNVFNWTRLMKFVNPPPIQKVLEQMGITLKSDTAVEDYYYNLLRPDIEQKIQLQGSLAFQHAYICNAIHNEPLTQSEITALENEMNVYKSTFTRKGETDFFEVNYTEKIQSLNIDFDIGMSLELRDMCGFVKPEHEKYSDIEFFNRCAARQFLTHLKRYNVQLKKNAYALSNFFVSQHNNWGDIDWNAEMDKETKTTKQTMVAAKSLYVFKELFGDLKLDSHDDQLFTKYLAFLKHELGIDCPSLAIPAWLFQKDESFSQLFFNDIPQFMTRFYRDDEVFLQLFAAQEKQYRMNELILGIDLITYCLWKCSKDMPMMNRISAELPLKMNPMNQIWVWSNIAAESIVNNSYKRLLAMGITETTWKKVPKGEEHEIVFSSPLYKSLSGSVFDEIDILITTKFGNPVPFVGGPLTVILRFERV